MKKNILVLNYEFPPLGGGGGVATEKLCKGWVELGYNVDIVTSGFLDLAKYENQKGIDIYRVKTFGRKERPTATTLSMLTYIIFAIPKAIKLAKSKKYDFINTQFVVPTGPVGYIISKLFGLKNIISIHGGDIYDPSKKSSPHRSSIYRFIIKKLFKSAYKIIAQSKNTKENAKKYYGDFNINIIPLAFEKPIFTKKTRNELRLDKDTFYLISIGRLVSRKGYKYLIEALSYINISNIKLILMGDGPERKDLEEQAKKLNISEKIIFLGEVLDNDKKYQYMENSDMYVLSSLHEGFGIVLQEAMEVGLPIVSTNNGGQTDFLIEGENALLLEIENAKKLAEKIKELYENNDLRQKMSINNIKDIKKFYIKNIAIKYLELIKKQGKKQ